MSGRPRSAPATPDGNLEANKRLATRFLELATHYRADECLAMMTPDATWWVLGDDDRLKASGTKDRTQIGKLLRGLATFIPEPMQLSIEGITAENERVAVEAECVGIWRNGEPYHNRYHFLLEMKAGLVHSVREYMDTLHLFEVLRRDRGP